MPKYRVEIAVGTRDRRWHTHHTTVEAENDEAVAAVATKATEDFLNAHNDEAAFLAPLHHERVERR